MAELLATAAKLAGDEKAPTYNAIAGTLWEKLPVLKNQFKAHTVALLADKEYAKVLEAVTKGDKRFGGRSYPQSRPRPPCHLLVARNTWRFSPFIVIHRRTLTFVSLYPVFACVAVCSRYF